MLSSRDRPTYCIAMGVVYGSMALLLAVVGAILGDMSIRYRRVLCQYYTSDGVNFLEHTTNQAYDANLDVSPTKQPVLPADCWTDTRHAVFYDPAYGRDIFFMTWGAIMFVLIIANIITEKMFSPEPSTESNQPDISNCRNCCFFNMWTLIFIAIALLIGGAVVGARYNQFTQGSCSLFTQSQDTQYTLWAVQYSGARTDDRSRGGIKKQNPLNVYDVEWASPRPYEGGNCWCDGTSVTFTDPFWVMVYYFCAVGALLIISVFISLCIFIFPSICCKKNPVNTPQISPGHPQNPPTSVAVPQFYQPNSIVVRQY